MPFVKEVGGQRLIEVEGHEAELKTILQSQLPDYARLQQSYPYPSMVNRNTDLDVWKAKASRLHLEGNRVKFRAAELTTAIAESCPEAFDAPSLCVYLKRVMFSKIHFESYSDLDFPVTEEMFKQIWLERLKEDKGYGETLRHAVKNYTSASSTVADLVESLAEHMNLTSDPKTLINAFNQNGQGTSEDVRSYMFRKHQESRTIMIDGQYDKGELVEIVIRGMREEEALKHRLLRKFRDNEIENFVHLKKHITTELLETKGATSEPIEQVNFTSGFQQPTSSQQQQSTTDRKNNRHRYINLYKVPHLNWPKNNEIPLHLHKEGKLYTRSWAVYTEEDGAGDEGRITTFVIVTPTSSNLSPSAMDMCLPHAKSGILGRHAPLLEKTDG